MKYAVIHNNGNVVNTIELEDGAEWSPPDCCQIVQSDEAGIGWTYANGVFTPPLVVEAPPPPPPPPSPLKVLTDLLVSKNLVSQTDITAAETEAGVSLNQTSAP